MGKLLHVWRVAEILACSKRTIYRLLQDRKLLAIKLGHRGIRITQESVEDYQRNNHWDQDK